MKYDYRIKWNRDGKGWTASGSFTAPFDMPMSEKASQVLTFEGVKIDEVCSVKINRRPPWWRFWRRA